MNVRYRPGYDQAGRHSCHLFLVIPAKADVILARPVPGWTVIQVYGLIKPADVRTFESYTENVNPDATLVILTSRGGYLSAGIDIGMRVHLKKLIVGVMGTCASSCALIWIGGETGRKFFYQHRPGVLTFLCFHQASLTCLRAPITWLHVVGPVSSRERIGQRISHQTRL